MPINAFLQTGINIAFIMYTLCPILQYIYSILTNQNVWDNLDGKWILITNATSEVGLAFCRYLAKKKTKIIITSPNEKELAKIKSELLKSTIVASYVVDYTNIHTYSFLDKYDIGLVVNKIGYFTNEPRIFIYENIDAVIENNFKGPLCLISAILEKMIEKRRGYIINIGFGLSCAPRPYFSLITSIKEAFKSWSECMYYELSYYNIVTEYMDIGSINLSTNEKPYFSVTPEELARYVFTRFGNSSFILPVISHFIQHLFICFIPRSIVARYRKLVRNYFSRRIKKLY